MSPRRARPVRSLEAALGVVAGGLVIGAIVALSYALLVPAAQDVEQPPPAAPVSTGVGPRLCPETVPPSSGEQPPSVSSGELVECPDLFDGVRISYEGEAVGAVMRQGSVAWLHVNDDDYALTLGPLPRHRLTAGTNAGMAVLIPEPAAEGIITGSFNRRGTGLAITGTYYKNHPADPGAPAIEADAVTVVRPALPVEHPISRPRLIAAGLLAALSVGLAGLWRRYR